MKKQIRTRRHLLWLATRDFLFEMRNPWARPLREALEFGGIPYFHHLPVA